MTIPKFVSCIDGPLIGKAVYREGADWKVGDIIRLTGERRWERVDNVWEQVYSAFFYILVNYGGVWSLEFVA